MSNSEEKTPTQEQEKILADIFQWKEAAEITDEDVAVLKQMFPEPKNFLVLRKVLSILSAGERGLLIPSMGVNMTKEDFDTEVRADEKIRAGLSNLYLLFKEDRKTEALKTLQQIDAEVQGEYEQKYAQYRKEKEEKAAAEFEEKKRQEEMAEQAEINKRVVGPNL